MTSLPVAVSTRNPAPNLSSRYVHINTQDIVTRMQHEGFTVAAARSAHPSRRSDMYAKHMIDFRPVDKSRMTIVGDSEPRIVFVNSHDGTSRASAHAGLFRLICSNGMVIRDKHFEGVQARHTGDAAADMVQQIIAMAQRTSALRVQIAAWQSKQLSKSARDLYGRLVAELRWGDAQMYDPEQVLRVRRAEDDHGDLWSTFNRAQENVMRGGLIGVSRSGRQSTSRPITDITRDTEFNAKLWEMTSEFAEVV